MHFYHVFQSFLVKLFFWWISQLLVNRWTKFWIFSQHLYPLWNLDFLNYFDLETWCERLALKKHLKLFKTSQFQHNLHSISLIKHSITIKTPSRPISTHQNHLNTWPADHQSEPGTSFYPNRPPLTQISN